MFLLGLALILLSFWFSAIALGGEVANFIDIPSLVFVIGPIVAVLTATRSFKVFYIGLRAAIFSKRSISEKSRRQAISLFRLLSKVAGMSAAIATLISLVNMLMNLDFADRGGLSVIGINIAAALISLIYGLLFIVAVFEPVVFLLKKRSNRERGSQSSNQYKHR